MADNENKGIPYSVETEKAALGSMLLDSGAALEGCGLLVEDDFYYTPHRTMFQAFCAVVAATGSADAALLWQQMEQAGTAEKVGISYLGEISMSVGTSVNLGHYCRVLKQLSYFRRLIDGGRRLAEAARKQEAEEVEGILGELRQDGATKVSTRNAAEIMEEYVGWLAEQRATGQIFRGLQTGFTDLDLILGGLCPGDLYILAGRPAMGKTALAIDIIRKGAKQLKTVGKVVLFFSVEMAERQIVARLYCGETGADNVFFTLQQDDGKWAAFLRDLERDGAGYEEMAEGVIIDDNGYQTPSGIRAICHGLRAKGREIGLIVIDYLQLLNGDKKTDSRVAELTEISRKLKLLAKDFECPILALSQLSRSVESRVDKRPMLSDLRDSGSIEQDADAVLFVYRDEYYNADSEKKGIAEVIVGKQRNGPTGTVELRWMAKSTSFRNLERGAAEPAKHFRQVKTKSPWDKA